MVTKTTDLIHQISRLTWFFAILFVILSGLFMSLYGFIRWRFCVDGVLCTLLLHPIHF
ncbi:hypothetical protein AM1_G0095 (plasmid) [Acaryochloris marina MBIC11017]|uniref:Uncharacterized protein n=1 Tax=Acaryochloris marina (strain MBIC 11017) TaxID=329726 RepID=A8ZQI9_ACAM1|nr:hypothetical protein AM1_G0095 [Acaryochloris marina MBIC11017]